MKVTTMKISIPILMLSIFESVNCFGPEMEGRMLEALGLTQKSMRFVEMSEQTTINREGVESTRLRREAELRRQQEEVRARQEAEQRRQEEEARAKREAELLRQREEVRAQQEAEVQLRMQELEDLGGNPEILSKFEKGSGNPEELQEYKATLNRADAEIVRLRKESDLNKQSMIDQLTEENQELRDMIEQLRKRMENLEKGNQ